MTVVPTVGFSGRLARGALVLFLLLTAQLATADDISVNVSGMGLVEGLTWDEIVRGLRETAVQLRLVVVPGPKGSTIIDDTYNANPESVMAALNLLDDLSGRHVAVLGDMLELGYMAEESHRLIQTSRLVMLDASHFFPFGGFTGTLEER